MDINNNYIQNHVSWMLDTIKNTFSYVHIPVFELLGFVFNAENVEIQLQIQTSKWFKGNAYKC